LNVFAVLILGTATVARAEQIGTFRLDDVFLEPTFRYIEAHRGEFSAGNSFLAAAWVRDSAISVNFKLGSKALLGVPLRYKSAPTVEAEHELTFVEAFGQAETTYGRIRAGLVPVPFGLEGGEAEAALQFDRSLFYRFRLIPLRDYGFNYHIDNEGFFSDWTVHNGEAGPDLDNEMWLTARWGYASGRTRRDRFIVGFSGSTGRTTPASTQSAGSSIATGSSRFRTGNFFFGWDRARFGVELEGSLGEIRIDRGAGDEVSKFRSGHFDLSYLLVEGTRLLARYDGYDPDIEKGNDTRQEASIGVAWSSRYETSSLSLLTTKVFLEGVTPDVHEVRLVWRLTPSVNPRLL
jgi:hypothetical protein